jgi:DNA-binding NarL/FixJ family response regulator
MKVMIVNNDSLQCEAIRTIACQSGCSQVNAISCGSDALAISRSIQPDIIVLGFHTEVSLHVKLLDELINSCAHADLIQLLPDVDSPNLATLMTRQISAILHVSDASGYLPSCLQCQQTKVFLSPRFSQLAGAEPNCTHPIYSLSHSELRIASLVLQGYSNKCIADLMVRSQHTIEDYRKRIKEKLGITGGKNALISYLAPFTRWLILTSSVNKVHY